MSNWTSWDTHVYRALTGHRPGITLRSEPTGLRDILASLEGTYGSQREAAVRLGVNDRTWRNWKSGRTGISPANQGKLRSAVRGSRLPAGRERRILSGGGPRMTVKSRYDGRSRMLDGRGLRYAPAALRTAVTLFLAGAPMRDVTKAFLGGVQEPFYESWLNPDNGRGEGFDVSRIRM